MELTRGPLICEETVSFFTSLAVSKAQPYTAHDGHMMAETKAEVEATPTGHTRQPHPPATQLQAGLTFCSTSRKRCRSEASKWSLWLL